jgi:hypothetical protein
VVSGPHTVSATYSQINSLGVAPGLISSTHNNAVIDSVVSGSTATVRIYGPGGVGSSYSEYMGSQTLSLPAASFTGQAFSTAYSLIWNTATSTYILTTGSPTSDSYVLVGRATTCNSRGTGGINGGG